MKTAYLRRVLIGVSAAALALTFAGATLATTRIEGTPVAWFDRIGPAGCATSTARCVAEDDAASTADPATTTPDDDYLAITSAMIPDAGTDDLLIAGQAACTTLDEEPAPDMAYANGVALGISSYYGWSAEQSGVVLGAAIAAWCPTYDYLMS